MGVDYHESGTGHIDAYKGACAAVLLLCSVAYNMVVALSFLIDYDGVGDFGKHFLHFGDSGGRSSDKHHYLAPVHTLFGTVIFRYIGKSRARDFGKFVVSLVNIDSLNRDCSDCLLYTSDAADE